MIKSRGEEFLLPYLYIMRNNSRSGVDVRLDTSEFSMDGERSRRVRDCKAFLKRNDFLRLQMCPGKSLHRTPDTVILH